MIALRPFETFAIPEHFVAEAESLKQLLAVSAVFMLLPVSIWWLFSSGSRAWWSNLKDEVRRPVHRRVKPRSGFTSGPQKGRFSARKACDGEECIAKKTGVEESSSRHSKSDQLPE